MMRSKRIFSFFLSLCIVASFSAISYAVGIDDTIVYTPLERDPAILQLNDGSGPILPVSPTSALSDAGVDLEANQIAAENAFNSLICSFYDAQPDFQKHGCDVYTVNGITAEGFPDSYAGAYVNRNYNLVVLLSEDTIANTRSLSRAQTSMLQAAGDNDIIFSSAVFPYSHLVSLMDAIYQYIESGRNGTEGFNVVNYCIDDFENSVMVGLEEAGLSNIMAFKSAVCDSDALAFSVAAPNSVETDYRLYPGGGLSNGSIGFRAVKRQNNKETYGFVTAAHCYNPGDSVGYPDNPYLLFGTASSLWQYSGNLDAVFIESDYDFSMDINGTDEKLRSAIDGALAQGDSVLKSGKRTGATTGIIRSFSYSFTSEHGKHLTDFGAATYNSDNGDSGGIVASTRTANKYIGGIHHGHEIVNGVFLSYFCKAINITPTFGLSLY